MDSLFQKIYEQVNIWRESNYRNKNSPVIAEILRFAKFEDGSLRFLRQAQLAALETYWYLRLEENTPHVTDLYKKYYPEPLDLLEVLGIPRQSRHIQQLMLRGSRKLFETLKADQKLCKELQLESLYETLNLDYPSYILALAMGAGKTILIGTIIATEFAMAMEYPDGPFIKNSLVFAPGKTIIESLKQISDIPFEKILPPRHYKQFSANLKLTFTRDGEKDIPIQRGSYFNLVVTNTEKIRIQKPTSRKKNYLQLKLKGKEAAEEAVANRRLQTIASLPHLGILSDEAHHTYGEEMEEELKKVRQTVNYLHKNTNVICVINTTGTPYYKRQPLKDVVVWYGLSQGIKDDILKEVSGNILSYDFTDDKLNDFVRDVVKDFFDEYRNVRLTDGSPAKIALYFPQEDDLIAVRPVVETTIVKMGLSTDIVLKNTSKSSQTEIDAFNRLNNKASAHRVILLVNKGTEGWDCPSLFACGLMRQLKASNNFVLQAATRCLRQIPGNSQKARIYLSQDNRAILEKQLNETYGETLAQLNNSFKDYTTEKIVVRKLKLPPLEITKEIKRIVIKTKSGKPIKFTLPKVAPNVTIKRSKLVIEQTGKRTRLIEPKMGEEIVSYGHTVDIYQAAVELSASYRLDADMILEALRVIYPDGEVFAVHLAELAAQLEKQLFEYTVEKQYVTRSLALIRPEGFNRENGNYVAEIRFLTDGPKKDLLTHFEKSRKADAKDLSFHYTPYDFDSRPELDFFERLLFSVNEKPENIEGFYFTGALTDPAKTDFFLEYKSDDGIWHRYTPDFLIRRKDGKCYIIEIKDEDRINDPIDGKNGKKDVAARELTICNSDKIKYELIFTGAAVPENKLITVKDFIKE